MDPRTVSPRGETTLLKTWAVLNSYAPRDLFGWGDLFVTDREIVWRPRRRDRWSVRLMTFGLRAAPTRIVIPFESIDTVRGTRGKKLTKSPEVRVRAGGHSYFFGFTSVHMVRHRSLGPLQRDADEFLRVVELQRDLVQTHDRQDSSIDAAPQQDAAPPQGGQR